MIATPPPLGRSMLMHRSFEDCAIMLGEFHDTEGRKPTLPFIVMAPLRLPDACSQAGVVNLMIAELLRTGMVRPTRTVFEIVCSLARGWRLRLAPSTWEISSPETSALRPTGHLREPPGWRRHIRELDSVGFFYAPGAVLETGGDIVAELEGCMRRGKLAGGMIMKAAS